jgi:hypothetical protein
MTALGIGGTTGIGRSSDMLPVLSVIAQFIVAGDHVFFVGLIFASAETTDAATTMLTSSGVSFFLAIACQFLSIRQHIETHLTYHARRKSTPARRRSTVVPRGRAGAMCCGASCYETLAGRRALHDCRLPAVIACGRVRALATDNLRLVIAFGIARSTSFSPPSVGAAP